MTRLLLPATFPKVSDKPYKWSVTLMETWPTRRWLCVAVQLCGVGVNLLPPVLSPEQSKTWSSSTLHLPDNFPFLNPLPTHCPHHPLFSMPDTVGNLVVDYLFCGWSER